MIRKSLTNRSHLARVAISVVLFVCVVASADCSGSHQDAPISGPTIVATSVRLDKDQVSLPDAGTSRLTATVLDQDQNPISSLGSDVSLTWSSDAPSVATVADGLISGVHPGTAHITVSLNRGGSQVASAQSAVTVQQVATTIAFLSSIPDSATVATTLNGVGVRLLDRHQDPVPGVTVSFHVTAPTTSAGSISQATAVTSSAGTATVTWTLSTLAGPNVVTATAGSLSTQYQTVGVASVPAAIEAISGSGQLAIPGTAVANPLVAKVVDKYGNPVAGVPVTWAIVAGDFAAFNPPPANTDAAGLSTVNRWWMGDLEEADTISASIAGADPAFFGAQSVFATEVRVFDANNQGIAGTVNVGVGGEVDLTARVYAGSTEIPNVCLVLDYDISSGVLAPPPPDVSCGDYNNPNLGGSAFSRARSRGPSLTRLRATNSKRAPRPLGTTPRAASRSLTPVGTINPIVLPKKSGLALSVRGAAQGSSSIAVSPAYPVFDATPPTATVSINVVDPIAFTVLSSVAFGPTLAPTDTIRVHVGNTVTLYAAAEDKNKQLLPAIWPGGARTFTWSTDAGGVVTLQGSQTGQMSPMQITAVAPGTVTVTAHTETFSAHVPYDATIPIVVSP